MELNWEQRMDINVAISSMHEQGDVTSFDINPNKQIEFPRGFLRTMSFYRSVFSFIEAGEIKEKISLHMMHRDTLHWLWLKTDISSYARKMIVKFQLINLACILEAVIKKLEPTMPKRKDSVYDRVDLLQEKGIISNGQELKELWNCRRSIHLQLSDTIELVDYSDENYKKWHSSIKAMLLDLNRTLGSEKK